MVQERAHDREALGGDGKVERRLALEVRNVAQRLGIGRLLEQPLDAELVALDGGRVQRRVAERILHRDVDELLAQRTEGVEVLLLLGLGGRREVGEQQVQHVVAVVRERIDGAASLKQYDQHVRETSRR